RPQVADVGTRGDGLVVEPAQDLDRLLPHPPAVQESPASQLVAEVDALGDRQVLDQVALLVDGGDAALEGPRRVAGRHRLTVHPYLARGPPHRPPDAPAQR